MALTFVPGYVTLEVFRERTLPGKHKDSGTRQTAWHRSPERRSYEKTDEETNSPIWGGLPD